MTESIIDATTLLKYTDYSVLALYGTNGLTSAHTEAIENLKLLEDIILFFDGVIGSGSISAINNYPNQTKLYNTFKSNRQKYYDDITQKSVDRYKAKHSNATEQEILKKTFKRFINGWTNRVNKFKDKTNENPKDVNCE